MSVCSKPVTTLNLVRFLAVYITITCFLLIANIHTIDAVTYEMADFAANSLLIQDAKSFSLWVGNYSRVGFNHPGPAILYVLALGEIVFHDWLHIVKFPFAGQIIAVAFYNALWMTLILNIFLKISKSLTTSIASLSVLLLTVALMDYSFFNGAWMPHLYLFPFITVVICLARLVAGKTDSLQALALSVGFLTNGHVSFVGILGVMLIFSLIANYVLFRFQPDRDNTLLSTEFISQHKSALGLACLTLFVFFIPLIIKTITDFPGPVMEYISFSGGHVANAFLDSAAFVAFYWGGWTIFTAGMIFLVAILAFARWLPAPLRTSLQALSISLLGATLALFIYARYGVDFLGQKYIGFFYYTVPALTIAFIFLTLAHALKVSGKHLLLLGLSTALLATTFNLIKKPVEYNYLYRDSGIPAGFEQLKSSRPETGLVLDLDNNIDWAQVWSSVLGLEAYSERQGVKIFCVGKNWHISFTKKYRCNAEENRLGKHLIVTGYNNYADQKPEFSSVGVSFYNYNTPDIANRGDLTILHSAAEFNQYFLVSGWSTVEKEIVWSDGKEQHLFFKITPGSVGTVKLDLEAFLPRSDSTQSVSFYINGQPVPVAKFNHQANRQQVPIPVTGNDQVQDIKLVIERPISPKNLGLSSDPRKLGVSLFGIRFDGTKQ